VPSWGHVGQPIGATAKLVGQAIRQARHDASLTQAQLAQRLETTTPYVTNVEAGRTNLTVGQLASIADALNAILDVNLRVVDDDRPVVQRAERHRRSRVPEPESKAHKVTAAFRDAPVAMP
jgi:transcriptional regulator with XRE-family HTH domain